MLIYHPEIFHELTEAGACNYVSCSDEFRDKGCAACSTCFESHAFCYKCEDNSYEIESNGNAYLADEQGTWECDSDEIHLCDLSDDCTTYDYEINGNNADVDTTLDDGGCSYNISFSVEQK